jgi:uncharacterized protein YqeY
VSGGKRNQKPPEKGNADMSLKERLLNDLKDAMRDKDDIRKDTIQICRAAVLQVEKDTRSVLDDNGVVEILAREFKKRSERYLNLGIVRM